MKNWENSFDFFLFNELFNYTKRYQLGRRIRIEWIGSSRWNGESSAYLWWFQSCWRETGPRRIFRDFGGMSMKRSEGQLFPLYGSAGMRVENRDQVGDRSEWDECGQFVIGIWLFLHVEMSGLKRTMELEFSWLNEVCWGVESTICCAMMCWSMSDNKF